MQSQVMQPPPQPNPQLSPQQQQQQQQQQQGPSMYPPQYQQIFNQPQAQQNPPPQPKVVYICPSLSCPPFEANYAGRTSHVLGAIQITGGVLAIVFQAILTGIQSKSRYLGAGFWCGVLFIIAGAFGVAAGKYTNKCLIIAYLVLAIIASFVTAGIFVGVTPGFDDDRYYMKYDHMPNYGASYEVRYYGSGSYGRGSGYYGRESGYYSGYDWYNSGETTYRNYWITSMVFNSLMVLVGVVELVTLIWGSVLAFKAMCCSNQGQQIPAVPVQCTHCQMIIAPGTNQMQVVPQTVPGGGSNVGYPMAMAASTQPTEDKQPLPETPPPGYA